MAKQKPEDEMVTRSIYIKRELYDKLQSASDTVGASLIISRLVEMWLEKKITIEIEPKL